MLGRFQLLVPIGEGGMGRVWVAREQGFTQRPRLVAIKTALAEDAAQEEYWKVLLDEARIASQVQHPNVCAIHALDRERGVVYLVMDWSDGGSLRELLDGLPDHYLEPAIAARLIAHVCAGLHAVHELTGEDGAPLGVVHRDVSPQNVLVSSNGQVKITDFGVAKARGQLHAPTETGQVKGKLSYMAPEQVTTKDIDRRADVFALGCVLYEASCGQRPFHGNDALSTLYQLLEEEVIPPSQRKAGYPAGLERIVLKALERDPDARYQTTEEMGRALQGWLASERAMISDSTIGELVKKALGERIEARGRAVEETLAELDRPAPTRSMPPEAAETLSGSAANTQPQAEVQHSSRRGLWLALAALAASSGVALVFLKPAPKVVSTPPLTTPITAAPTPEATPKPVVAPAKLNAVITLSADPPGVSLQIDDGPPLPNPYTLNVAADGSKHVVRASFEGYAPRTQEIVYDGDKQVSIVLSERTSRVASNSRSGRAKNHSSSPTTTATSVEAASPAPSPTTPVPPPLLPGELPTVSRKTRVLDGDNPFAKP